MNDHIEIEVTSYKANIRIVTNKQIDREESSLNDYNLQ